MITCKITGTLTKPDGSPDTGASILAVLSQNVVYNSIVVPSRVLARSDTTGKFTFNLWPNALLTTPVTFYRVLIVSSSGEFLTYSIKVPNQVTAKIENLIDNTKSSNPNEDLAAILMTMAKIEDSVTKDADEVAKETAEIKGAIDPLKARITALEATTSPDLDPLKARVAILEAEPKVDLKPLKSEITTLESEINDSVKSITINDADQIVITHFNGASHLIETRAKVVNLAPLKLRIKTLESEYTAQGLDLTALKDKLGQVNHGLKEAPDAFIYSGENLPVYPDNPRDEYYLNFKTIGPKHLQVPMPAPAKGAIRDGAIFHISNAGKQVEIVIKPDQNETIDGLSELSIPINSWAFLVKKGTNWIRVEYGLLSTRTYPVNHDKITNSQDNGDIPVNQVNLISLTKGWWSIPDSNTSLTDKPPNINGFFEVLKINLTSGSKSPFSLLLAFGKNTQNFATIWVKYRIKDDVWTSWNLATGDISSILTNIENLKSGNLEILSKLKNLKTSLGDIYAPTKNSFETSTNALITSALKTHKDILQSEGWGPLGDVPGAGNLPLPKNITKIYATYSVNLPTTIGSVEQVSSTTGTLDLRRNDASLKRIFVMIPNDQNQANDVTGFVVDDGIKAKWTSLGSNINGKDFKIFYSPGGYVNKNNQVQVLFKNKSGSYVRNP